MFSRLFMGAVSNNGDTAPILPPPFCLEPPLDAQCNYAPGEEFHFTLKLFSYATDYLPYFIHALTLAGQHGMGRNAENRQGLFRIINVLYDGNSVYDTNSAQLYPYSAEILPIPLPCHNTKEKSLELEFITPLRFKHENHLATRLDFSQIFLLILRRLKSLHSLDDTTFALPPHDFSLLMDAASTMRVEENKLCWLDWSRYSGRQQTTMQLGGLVGRIRYYGPTELFREYLAFASKTHIGKQTSFGLGALVLPDEYVSL